ncbi:hypothetical protein VNO78_12763 [Psophocarpus tetragonolobus]|uniref:Uncharacterized protein n=1 Tax=Psophocarpus tetragonolobus TaxID=3891 RepID=A0AAN9XPR9_PSOTE
MANSYLSLIVLIHVVLLLTLQGFAESDSYKLPYKPEIHISNQPRVPPPPPPIPNPPVVPIKKPPMYTNPPYKKPKVEDTYYSEIDAAMSSKSIQRVVAAAANSFIDNASSVENALLNPQCSFLASS